MSGGELVALLRPPNLFQEPSPAHDVLVALSEPPSRPCPNQRIQPFAANVERRVLDPDMAGPSAAFVAPAKERGCVHHGLHLSFHHALFPSTRRGVTSVRSIVTKWTADTSTIH